MAKPGFRYRSNGKIWQVLPLAQGGGWVVEERHAETGVQYCRLDERGSLRWRARPWPERWWTQLAAAAEKWVLVREYSDEQSPEHQQLHALQGATGEHQWTVDNFSLLSAPDTTAYGYLSTENGVRPARIHLDTGEVAETKTLPEPFPKNNSVHRPFLYREEDPHFATVSAYVQQEEARARPVVGAEYWQGDCGVGLSWYERQPNGKLTNWLWWMDRAGERQIGVQLGQDLEGLAQDSFWIRDNHLFYIKDKQELVGYAV